MDLSFRRVAGRFVLAAGVCAAALLVFRGDKAPTGVTFVVDARPLGAELRHLDVTITDGDDVLATWQTGDWDRRQPLRPLELKTPTPHGEVEITLDVLTENGVHRVVHKARPQSGGRVEVVLGATSP